MIINSRRKKLIIKAKVLSGSGRLIKVKDSGMKIPPKSFNLSLLYQIHRPRNWIGISLSYDIFKVDKRR